MRLKGAGNRKEWDLLKELLCEEGGVVCAGTSKGSEMSYDSVRATLTLSFGLAPLTQNKTPEEIPMPKQIKP